MNCSPIARITPGEVKGGNLSRLFRRVPALILHEDERISRLVESTFDWLGLGDRSARDGQLSFASNLFDLARNHHEGNMWAGDMLRFVPNLFGHIARKFLVYPGAGDNSLEVWPAVFHSSNLQIAVPREIVEPAWNLISEVLVSALPAQIRSLAYAVEVDVLVYPTSSSDVRNLHSLLIDGTLLADSSSTAGFWSQLGHRMDASKDRAAGVFNRRGIRDLFAIASQIPGLRGPIALINEKMPAAGKGSKRRGLQVVGGAHVDGSKYITGLMGRRENLYTEYLWEGRWFSLPVTDDAMAVFPSARASSVSDVPATRHRVLVHDPTGDAGAASQNLTLSLAVIDLPAGLPKY